MAGRAGCLVAHVILMLCHCHLSSFWSVGPLPFFLPLSFLTTAVTIISTYLWNQKFRGLHTPLQSPPSPLSLYTINVHGSGCQGIVTSMSPVESFATGIKFFWLFDFSKVKLQPRILDPLIFSARRLPWSLDRFSKRALIAWYNFDPSRKHFYKWLHLDVVWHV